MYALDATRMTPLSFRPQLRPGSPAWCRTGESRVQGGSCGGNLLRPVVLTGHRHDCARSCIVFSDVRARRWRTMCRTRRSVPLALIMARVTIRAQGRMQQKPPRPVGITIAVVGWKGLCICPYSSRDTDGRLFPTTAARCSASATDIRYRFAMPWRRMQVACQCSSFDNGDGSLMREG